MAVKKVTIGWQEWVSLPEINIAAIKVKVDTGARTSSLHAENIKHFQKDGKKYVRFVVYPLQKNRKLAVECEAPLVEKRSVKSSNGGKERRPVIKTMIELAGRKWEIELNLTKRDYMSMHMLLGRNAMQGQLVIDPEKILLHGDLKNSKLNKLYKD